MFKNTEKSWGLGAQLLHWLIFFVFTGLLVVGNVMGDIPRDGQVFGMMRGEVYGLHKSFGMLMLFLVFVRISWRMANVTPQTYNATKLENLLAHGTHFLLYVVMLAMPISGYVMSSAGGRTVYFFGVELPNLIGVNKAIGGFAHESHEVIATAIYVLLFLHISAAFAHHFVKKDNVLLAMLPWGCCCKKNK